ncbi:MAG: hypothetical protein LUF32_06215 [Clostridiales bacterium]|nr:hypothetical protein [Clostridiales bacterium]
MGKTKDGDLPEKTQKKERTGGVFGISRKGSFTVEAVFLFPIILFLVAFMLHLSMDWFESIRQTAEDIDTLQELDMRTCFLRQDALQGILDSLLQ